MRLVLKKVKVDLDEGKMYVTLPEGLYEIYE